MGNGLKGGGPGGKWIPKVAKILGLKMRLKAVGVLVLVVL